MDWCNWHIVLLPEELFLTFLVSQVCWRWISSVFLGQKRFFVFFFPFILRWKFLWYRILGCWFLSSNALKKFTPVSFCFYGYWWESYCISYPCSSLGKVSISSLCFLFLAVYMLMFSYSFCLYLSSLMFSELP